MIIALLQNIDLIDILREAPFRNVPVHTGIAQINFDPPPKKKKKKNNNKLPIWTWTNVQKGQMDIENENILSHYSQFPLEEASEY